MRRKARHFESFFPTSATTWRAQLPWLLECLKCGDSHAKATALDQLMQMAAVADSVAERAARELAERTIAKAMDGDNYIPF
jgi:hypothetical protein